MTTTMLLLVCIRAKFDIIYKVLIEGIHRGERERGKVGN